MNSRITLEGVEKRYVKYDDTPLLATRALRWRTQSSQSELWALRDINFSVAPGECLGVIGHNGSGKSTLLRLLAGVTGPTRGRVQVRGRIAPLISVGVGFHHELTGRENVYVNGIILGLPREDIDRRFDEIVDFAEIGSFIDTPVKFYSSGMFMRLGFAVSVLADPQVLLIDEVLSVGDVAFQNKCMERMSAIKSAGATLVLVSHNLNSVRRMCDRTIVLHNGRVHHDGDTGEAVGLLHGLLAESPNEGPDVPAKAKGELQDQVATVANFDLLDRSGVPTRKVTVGEPICLAMDVQFLSAEAAIRFGVLLYNEVGIQVYQTYAIFRSTHHLALGEPHRVVVELDSRLASGSYTAQLGVARADGTAVSLVRAPLEFYVDGSSTVAGVADLGARFIVNGSTGLVADERLPSTRW